MLQDKDHLVTMASQTNLVRKSKLLSISTQRCRRYKMVRIHHKRDLEKGYFKSHHWVHLTPVKLKIAMCMLTSPVMFMSIRPIKWIHQRIHRMCKNPLIMALK
jgi:hypothetical protein